MTVGKVAELRKAGFFLLLGFLFLSLPTWGQDLVASEINKADILKTKLKRLVVGNQGAILKVWKAEGVSEPAYYRGLDDRDTAPYSKEDQEALLTSLEMTGEEIEKAAIDAMNGYDTLPKKNAIAFLGLVYSIQDDSPLEPSDEIDAKVKAFLLTRLKEDKSVIMRRQACLALAVGDGADEEVIEAILDFYSQSENLWETFPVQQFFEYHSAEIKAMAGFAQIRARAAAVDSLYTNNILGYLDQ